MKTLRVSSALSARDGLKLHLHHWLVANPRGVVVMVHGLSEHAGFHASTAQQLNQSGWNVIAPDLRGHGLSDGPRGATQHDDDFMYDLADVIDVARHHFGGLPLVLMGHSLGGSIVARMAAAQAHGAESEPWSRPVDGLVLSSPSLQPAIGMVQRGLLSAMGRLIQDVALPVIFKPEWISSDPITIEAYKEDPLVHGRMTPRVGAFVMQQGQLVQARATRWTVPTLVLYSPDDKLIKPQACELFAQALPPGLSTIQSFAGFAHNIWREPGSAVAHDALRQWLAKTFPAV
jgi:alpha-beta hydrolase superfamily lysophospholipase